MKIKIFAIALTMGTVVSYAQYVKLNIQPTDYEKNYPMGQDESLTTNIPLPNGIWKTIQGDENSRPTVNKRGIEGPPFKFRQIWMINERNGVLLHHLSITAKVNSLPMTFTDELCKGDDYIYKNNYGTKLWDQRCLTINQAPYLNQSGNHTQEMMQDYLNSKNIQYRHESINLTIQQFSRNGKNAKISLRFFPSNYGFIDPVSASGLASPWGISNIKSDPQKTKFINAIIDWAENYASIFFKSFDEEKAQDTPIPEFSWGQPQKLQQQP